MAFVSELLTYLFKFIMLGGVAVAGAICGTKIKANKNAKEASGSESKDNA